MPEEPEPGHVGDGVRRARAQQLGRVLVERPHPLDGALVRLGAGQATLVPAHDQAGPEGFRQEQRIAGPRAVLRPDRLRVGGADDGEPVLGLGVADRVPAREQRAGDAHLLVRSREDRGDRLHRQLLGKRGDGECQQRHAAHREDVVERVRRRDRPVVGWVVDERREEVDGEDQRSLVVELVDRGVVGRREPDQQVLGLNRDESLEQLLEPRRRVLRGTPARDGEIRQPDRGHSDTLDAGRTMDGGRGAAVQGEEEPFRRLSVSL